MNREEGHISLRQGFVLAYTVMVAKLFLQYPEFLVDVGGPAGWLVALVMTGFALLLFLPVVALVRRFPGDGLAAIGERVAGPVLGTLITLVISAWLFVDTAFTVRGFSETFLIAIVPATPPTVLMIVGMLGVAYASYQGLEAMARTAQVLFPLILVGTLVGVIMDLPRADPSRLFPILGHGLPSLVGGGFIMSGMAGEVIILLAFGYAFRDAKAFRSSALLSILLFGLTASFIVAVLIMTFGAPDAAQQPFPMYRLARMIYLGRFVQRMESIIVMLWFFAAAVRVSVTFHACVVSLAGALRLPYYRPLIPVIVVLVISLAMAPEDLIAVLRTDRDWIRPLGIGIILLPALLLVIAMVRKKGGQTHAA
ncbi:MAG: gerXB [Firmicutes bacterium]|nr:gerXB [Bacillota bacterium]